MKPYPHHYTASATGAAIGSVVISAPTLPRIETAPPPEFDGPGGIWSPETLLCAAVADCFILTFRSVARAAHFNWTALECRVEGVLEHIGSASQFTSFATSVQLTVPPGADPARARLLLSRSEQACLIANSLRGERTLAIDILTGESAADPPGRPQDCSADDAEHCASAAGPQQAAGCAS
jgi:organic hydroperoxide reductase OsmC/OhrA